MTNILLNYLAVLELVGHAYFVRQPDSNPIAHLFNLNVNWSQQGIDCNWIGDVNLEISVLRFGTNTQTTAWRND